VRKVERSVVNIRSSSNQEKKTQSQEIFELKV
jgi:hypothetical protein